MEKQKRNYAWIIPLIIGCIIGFVGLVLVIKANNQPLQEPTFLDPTNDFEEAVNNIHKSTRDFSKMATGIFLMVLGFLMIGLIGSFTTYGVIKTLSAQKSFMKAAGRITTSTFESINQRIRGEKPKTYCKYCGTLIDEEKGVCPGCGAKPSKDE